MRDDQIRSRLRETNPWWQAAASGADPVAWAQTDRTLRGRAPYDLGYRPSLLNDVAHGPLDDKLVVLRGPRRVGKSVLLKDTAEALCRRSDLSPLQLIYVPTDSMNERDIGRMFRLGRALTAAVDSGDLRRRVWLLDEITGIAKWAEAVKYERDQTLVGDDTVVCTGSSWAGPGKVERALTVGRAGTVTVDRIRILLPMSFRQVLSSTHSDMPLPPVINPWALQDPAARTAAAALEFHTDELDLAWQGYLESGGFPRAVAEYTRQSQVTGAFLRDLEAWLHTDVDPGASEESIPRLLAELASRSTSPLNQRNTAQALGYTTAKMFTLRLARLEGSFAVCRCPQIDERGQHVPGSQSKTYLADPLLAWLPSRRRAGLPTPDHTQLSEAALAVAMARAVDRLQAGRWLAGDAIGYVRTGSGNEIDLGPVPIPTPGGTEMTTPIESKWVDAEWRGEAKVIEGRFGSGILATKRVTDFSHPAWALPAPVVALMLG